MFDTFRKKIRLSIRTKFAIVFAIIIAFPIIFISYYSYHTIKLKQNSILQERLGGASIDVSNMLIYYMKSAVQKSDLAAELVGDSLALRPDEVQNFLYFKQDIWDNAIVEIFDANKKLLGRSFDGEPGTVSFFADEGSEILEQTLHLAKIADFFASPAGISIRASTPIIAPHDLSCLGAVIVTYPFDTQLLYKIKSSVKHDIFLYVDHMNAMHSTASTDLMHERFLISDKSRIKSEKMLIKVDIVDGRHYESAYRPIVNFEGATLGYISASIDRDIIDHDINNAFKKLCIELVISLSGAIVIIYLVTKYLTNPIYYLSESIKKMTLENTFRDVVIEQNDEIGDLAKSFNNMISELRRKQESLARTERKYRNIFINSVEGIMQIGMDFRIADCNISAARMFGYDDVRGFMKTVVNVKEQLFPDVAAADSFFGMVASRGKVKIHEIEMVRRDGTRFPALISMHLASEADSGSSVFEGSIADISARKEKEKAETARDAAEKASEFKSLFLANMSHEIRTPLNAIIGMSGVLQKTDLAEKQGQYVRVIDTASRNLLHLVTEILDFSKIESGQMRIEEEAFDLEEMVDEILSLFMAQTSRKDIEFIADIDENVPRILLSDQFRLRQVLINLCSNAFKFTERGEIVIAVRVRALGAEGCELLFEVSDTGIGIPMDKRDRLFDAFQQADSSTTRRYGGTGLGLTICRKIVEMLGGGIWIDPGYHAGSRFCFTIRAAVPERPGAASDGPESLAGVRVMLVSASEKLTQVVPQLLSGFGCAITRISPCDSLPGLTPLPDHFDHDLAVIDCPLGEGGIEEFMRSYLAAKGDAARVIVLLPYGAQAEGRLFGGQGRVEFMNKPLRRRHLLRRVLELFGQSGGGTDQDAAATKSRQLDGKRILLVEDNEFNQMVAQEVLGDYGLDVTMADNGKVAVDLLAGGHVFDLVFMDVQMPIMDGFEATAIIREQLGMRHLPIVAMTAHATTGDRDRCLEKGMDDYLTKPMERRRLEDVLGRYLCP
jgi:two-component system, sensor histidine kinase and response regulator